MQHNAYKVKLELIGAHILYFPLLLQTSESRNLFSDSTNLHYNTGHP